MLVFSRGFPGDGSSKEPDANVGDLRDVSSIPELGRSLGGGHGNPLWYSCLENSMDRGSWWATVYGSCKEWDMTEWLSFNIKYYL